MKRIIPNMIYHGRPCSVVVLGSALGITDSDAVEGLYSDDLKEDGYLSLDAMRRLIKSKFDAVKEVYYRRNERITLADWAHENEGKKAIVCVLGHYVYFDGKDYHSFFCNGRHAVVNVWYIKGGK